MAKKADLQYYGTGRRKSSVARVYVTSGTGKIVVNGHDVNEYMPYQTLVLDLRQPLVITGTEGKYDVKAEVVACRAFVPVTGSRAYIIGASAPSLHLLNQGPHCSRCPEIEYRVKALVFFFDNFSAHLSAKMQLNYQFRSIIIDSN